MPAFELLKLVNWPGPLVLVKSKVLALKPTGVCLPSVQRLSNQASNLIVRDPVVHFIELIENLPHV
jgi:hypothetical protein